MASFAFVRHYSSLIRLSTHRRIIGRSLHASPVAPKKKASTLEIQDLFTDEAGEDLLSSTHDTPPSPSYAEGRGNAIPKKSAPSKHLDSTTRHARFEELYKSVLTQTSLDPKQRRKVPPMRNSVWIHLVDLSQNEVELGKVIALVPKWKDMTRHQPGKGGLEERWGELVVGHAESLSCAKLALDMFSNHAKYQVPLSLPAARHLLHALHMEHPLQDVMTAVALFRVYRLNPIADDLVSLGLVCRALAGRIYQAAPPTSSSKTDNIQALKQVFETLVQSLRDLVASTDPSLFNVSPHARIRALTPRFTERQKRADNGLAALEKEKTWLKWCLKRIEDNLRASEGFENVAWLRHWREAAGHFKTDLTR
ncbi:hypothetical protein J3R30DRAFT_84039 [Lentinula aciculospora]|uniref:Uncharacterized protein n=1 Tax=Lentinula aciculospora TaxID=153920 RepID=A0A9W9AW59_9AGAR|nr:hypothetical protein J3R30DRAFT_84039 [Lentinula aciculospora]